LNSLSEKLKINIPEMKREKPNMKTSLSNITCLILLYSLITLPYDSFGQTRNGNIYAGSNAYLVVTGMRLNEDPKNFVQDLSVAEGAVVKLIMKNGKTLEKTTQRFSWTKNSTAKNYFTADFKVSLDTTYSIKMTYKDGTEILIYNYCLPSQWKTHFYFHSTNGTVWPASVLRSEEDIKTNLKCCVFGVYPFESYKALGGTQLDN
jgi:hypothetical protein